MTIVQQASGTFSGTSLVAALPAASAASNAVVLIIAGNTIISGNPSTPGASVQGFVLRRAEVNQMGHYLLDRAGGSASYTLTMSAGQGTWWLAEIQGGSYDSGAAALSANSTAGSAAYNTPTLTPTAGTRILVASLGSTVSGGAARTISGWTSSFVEQADVAYVGADGPMQGVAVLDNLTSNGSTSYSTTATYSAVSTGRSAIIASYATSTGGTSTSAAGSAASAAGQALPGSAAGTSTSTNGTAAGSSAGGAGQAKSGTATANAAAAGNSDRWNTAKATGTAVWAHVGDSVGEGQGATTRNNRWVNKALTAMRTAWQPAGVVGGQGFVPAWYSVTTDSASWANPYSSRSSSGIQDLTWAPTPGYHQTTLGAGATATYPVVGTAVDIWFIDSTGAWTYSVDGGTAVTVPQGNSFNLSQLRVSLGTAGSHTLTLTCTSGYVDMAGKFEFNGDTTTGIRLHDASHYGYTSANYGQDTGYLAYWGANAIGVVKPDLVTIMLGGNDMNAGNAGQVKGYLQAVIASIRAGCTVQPSIVVCTYYKPQGTADWATLDAQIRAVVTEDPTIGLIDFYAAMGQVDTVRSYWASDLTHPSDSGHAVMAQIAGAALGVPAGVTAVGTPALGSGRSAAGTTSASANANPVRPAAGSGSAASGIPSVAALIQGAAARGSGQTAAGSPIAAQTATATGLTAQGSGQSRTSAATASATSSGAAAAGSGRTAAGNATAVANVAAVGGTAPGSGLASSGVAQAAVTAIALGSPASGAGRTASGLAAAGQFVTAVGTSATGAAQAAPGQASGQANVLALGAPAAGTGQAQAGTVTLSALFTGGSATGSGQTLAGLGVGVAVVSTIAYGGSVYGSGRARSGVGSTETAAPSPAVLHPRLLVQPNLARLAVQPNQAGLHVQPNTATLQLEGR